MGKTSGSTVVNQARLLHTLLKSSPENSVRKHAGDVIDFLYLLHDRYEITHSVSLRFSEKNLSVLTPFFLDHSHQFFEQIVLQNRKIITLILEDIINRKIKVVLKSN